jgi:hypothetical protein
MLRYSEASVLFRTDGTDASEYLIMTSKHQMA